jgi:hypothetical protein
MLMLFPMADDANIDNTKPTIYFVKNQNQVISAKNNSLPFRRTTTNNVRAPGDVFKMLLTMS